MAPNETYAPQYQLYRMAVYTMYTTSSWWPIDTSRPAIREEAYSRYVGMDFFMDDSKTCQASAILMLAISVSVKVRPSTDSQDLARLAGQCPDSAQELWQVYAMYSMVLTTSSWWSTLAPCFTSCFTRTVDKCTQCTLWYSPLHPGDPHWPPASPAA